MNGDYYLYKHGSSDTIRYTHNKLEWTVTITSASNGSSDTVRYTHNKLEWTVTISSTNNGSSDPHSGQTGSQKRTAMKIER